jgi:hypothetical protein
VPNLEFTGNDVTVIFVPPLCQSDIPNRSGVFKLDKLTGAIIFERSDCSAPLPVSCIFGPASGLDNVVSAKAVVHSDSWTYTFMNVAAAVNPFEGAERGKWRPKASYAYNTSLNQVNDRNFNGGTFKFKTFNWKSGEKSNYPGWLKVNQIEKYTPNGDPVEERNALNIPSAAKFGYRNAVPYLVAQNSEYGSVLFESFENSYSGGILEDGFIINGGATIDATVSHSGKNSFRLVGARTVNIRSFPTTNQIKNVGIQAKVWIKGSVSNSVTMQLVNSSNVQIGSSSFVWIANAGDWSLYEAILSPASFSTLATGSTFSLRFYHSGSVTINIDDLRIQPKDSELTAYVYDTSNLRLLAVFDDQHFGLYYQYNAEGKLIRKLIETERGIRMVQETQYNTIKVNRN